MARAPAGLLEDICEMRAYAKAHTLYQQACEMRDEQARRKVLDDPLVRQVQEIEFALVRAERAGGDG